MEGAARGAVDKDEKVLLLTFPDAATQRRALGRASMYLEDPEHRGRVAKALPAGARGGGELQWTQRAGARVGGVL